MISNNLEEFVGLEEWVLVEYSPFEGQHNLAWINILESGDSIYKVLEVDSCYYEGDITSNNYRYIGGSSNKRHLICDEKIRSKEEVRMFEPGKTISLADVFKE